MMVYPESVMKEQLGYRSKVKEFLSGDITEKEFKPIRSCFGIYEQRQDGKYMVRAKIAAGVSSIKQLDSLIEIADRYAWNLLHFTTRQDIQFHGTSIEDTANILDELLGIGIITKGAGGNTVRNIAASPLSGVDPEGVFDVTEYALGINEHLIKDPSAFKLPRKYKISVSDSWKDSANAGIADLGFIAKEFDGKIGFSVYGGGGLGPNPSRSLILDEFIDDKMILYHVEAMKILFQREGDYENRNKARIRYILGRLGEDKFKELYKDILQEVIKNNDLDLTVEYGIDTEKKRPVMKIDKKEKLLPQIQSGKYSVYVHPTGGYISTDDLKSITGFLKSLPYETSIRLTSTQGFYIRDLSQSDGETLLKVIEDIMPDYPLASSVSCTGAGTCRVGMLKSKELLGETVKRFNDEQLDTKRQLPRIFISGCRNSCGQHQKGEIGLCGKKKKVNGRAMPFYAVFLDGLVEGNKTRLGAEVGDVPAKKIPEFLVALAKAIKETGNLATNEVVELIKKYNHFEEDVPEDMYLDY
ncbi:nitrite/sulfite reductase [Alkalibacter saccharofermentans]|uniref:Sulfite reductase (Ferredoxin) n=1 Tax=Alkalibacter saccharofermentans DSM 14828 TaxID=1120975 RepID=A0A1M4Z9S2_9FIRM|nr:nitrite/sulfite reductase [Alkalibacter saccharofermentans]SHF14725.1 sulfite reductase (ferredoxin) [Alkalibacter saccharofermentans DSM 14828]